MPPYTNIIKRRDGDRDITVYHWNEAKYPLIVLIEWEEGGENRAIEFELSAQEMMKILGL
jgi:hypothetical protein